MSPPMPPEPGGVVAARLRTCPYCGAPLKPFWAWTPECSRCDGRNLPRSLPGTATDVLATESTAQAIDAAWERWLFAQGYLLPHAASDPALDGLVVSPEVFRSG